MFCAKCGKEMDDNAKFCPSCGAGTSVDTGTTYEQPKAPANDIAQPYSQPAYTPPAYKEVTPNQSSNSGLPLGSMICGIIGLVLCWVPIVGLILSIIAIVLAGKAKKVVPAGERGMATAGFIMGIIGLVISIIVLIVWIVTIAFIGTLGGMAFSMLDLADYGY